MRAVGDRYSGQVADKHNSVLGAFSFHVQDIALVLLDNVFKSQADYFLTP